MPALCLLAGLLPRTGLLPPGGLRVGGVGLLVARGGEAVGAQEQQPQPQSEERRQALALRRGGGQHGLGHGLGQLPGQGEGRGQGGRAYITVSFTSLAASWSESM
jgi:hypothetical protein